MFEGWQFTDGATWRPSPTRPESDADGPSVGVAWPPDRPSDAILDAAAVRRILDALPQSYALRLMQAAARAAGWKGPVPDVGQVLQHGLEWRCRPGVGPLTARREHRRHEQHRALAHAVAARAGALSRHVDNDVLRLLAATEAQIRDEASAIATGMTVAEVAALTGCDAPTAHRLCCPRYVRRRLRREINRADAHVQSVLGLVGGRRPAKGEKDHRQLYVSNYTLARWRDRQETSNAYLSEQVIVNKATGEAICTAAEAKASGDRHRRATMIALVHGLRESAKRDGLVPVAITLTLPPKYHPNPSDGTYRYDPAITPDAMFRKLQECWHRVAVLLRKRGIRVYGIWTPEPHEDGCPHRHAILWCDPSRRADLESAVKRHFPGPEGVAVRFAWLDERGSAAVETYVLCYALKMTGNAPSSKAEAPDGEEHLANNFDRFRAWKSVFGGARSWGFVGLRRGVVGQYRALFKLSAREEKGEVIECARTRVILRAIRRRQHATALRLMGAFVDTPTRRERGATFKAVREERTTAYGDTAVVTVGYCHARTGFEVRTKRGTLGLMTAAEARELAVRLPGEAGVSDVVSVPRVGAGAPPSSGQTGQGAAAGPPRRPPRPLGEAPANHQTDVAHREHERALVARIRTRADAAAAAGREAARQIAREVETDEAAAAAAQAGWNDAVAAMLAADATLAAAVAAMAPT